MDHRAKALIATGVCFLAAACSSSGSAPTPSPSSPKVATPAQRYLHLLRTETIEGDGVAGYGDSELVTWGRRVCVMLAHPADHPYGPANDMLKAGWDAPAALAVGAAADRFLC